MHNARLTERTSFLGQVDVVPHATDRSLRVWGQDVSETGMFLQTTQPFRTGDTLSLRFDVDEHEVHVRAAEVVWVRKFEPICVDGKVPGIGLRFISVDPPARAALRRLAAPRNDNRDTVVDQPAPGPSLLPAPRLTLPPLTDSILQKARGGRVITQEIPGLSISLAPFSQPPLAISMPPDEPMLASESRVFEGVPAGPRAVTMGPRKSTREISQPFLPAPRDLADDDADVDLFVGWTFQRPTDLSPVEHSEEEQPAPSFHQRFDDDAPLHLDRSIIEEPSILESASLPPQDAFTMGSLPPAFDDGTLAIRHLPLLAERALAPTTTTTTKGPRRSVGPAVAFLLAGFCAGGLAGVVHHQSSTRAAPVPAVVVATTTTTQPELPLVPLAPLSVDAAEADLVIAPPPVIEPLPAQPEPTKIAKAVEPESKAENKAVMTSSTKPPPAPEPLLARPGRLEIDLPVGGKVLSAFALSSPARVVVDLKGAELPGKAVDVDEGGVLQLRFGHPKVGTERVVIVVAGSDKPMKPRARVEGRRLIVTWSW